jgi:UDP-N-acetylmuramate: L-alanyl-gamma-D-glutamyl-meso-diaminopimelate ligase
MQQHLFFLGIGGTLIGSLALLAKEMGYSVSGCDNAIYPPMSDLLSNAKIKVFEGFNPDQLDPEPNQIIIGNAGLARGNDAIEYILNAGLRYTSGAEWLGRTVLKDRWVLAVAGTHGKTTTASLLAWILEYAGLKPGFLIGGAPSNFEQSARLGETPFFVVEADEYDTSYFDRRSKFVHYKPRTLILNNLEFDHADIFSDIGAIQDQFHLLMRTVPEEGLVIAPSVSDYINEVLARGCWSPVTRIGQKATKKEFARDNGETWTAANTDTDGSAFDVCLNDKLLGRVNWSLIGKHNIDNGLNAIAAARHVGIQAETCIEALTSFSGVKRRLEVIFENEHSVIYDDFAHHPTAIRTTLQGLRKRVGSDEILAIIEPRTHTMSLGSLSNDLSTCCAAADAVIWFRGENIKWDLGEVINNCLVPAEIADNVPALVKKLAAQMPGEKQRKRHIVIMSNGAFGGIYEQLLEAFAQ